MNDTQKQRLFNFFEQEYGITLLDSEMDEVAQICGAVRHKPNEQIQTTTKGKEMKTTKELPGNTRALIAKLRGHDWQTSRELYERGLFSWCSIGDARREMRDAAEHSDGQIISGQNGYKLTVRATADEIDHAANRLHHQASLMLYRAIAIVEFAHDCERKRKGRRTC